MDNLNVLMMEGRLTRDPELKYTNSGTAICKLSIACNRSYKGSDGQYVKEVTYMEIEVWGKQGENANQYLTKGRGIRVHGMLKQDRWEQDGQQRSKHILKADRIDYMAEAAPEGEQAQRPRPQKQATAAADPDDFNDDIPF